MGVGESHSLLAMYVSAEKQTFDQDWYRGRAPHPPKNQHVVNFQTTENKLVAIHSSPVKTHEELPCSRKAKAHKQLPFVRWKWRHNLGYGRNPNSKIMPRGELWEKRKNLSFEWTSLRGMVSLVKRIHKGKTCSRGKRQLLILVLSEIRRVSFYQRVMETQ